MAQVEERTEVDWGDEKVRGGVDLAEEHQEPVHHCCCLVLGAGKVTSPISGFRCVSWEMIQQWCGVEGLELRFRVWS